MEKKNDTRLITRHSQFPTVCIYCNRTIEPNDLHYIEASSKEHIHSLLARKYCEACFSKYGEKLLLQE